MLSFKKIYRDELLQLALLLSMLRVNQDSLYENDIYEGINSWDLDNGTSWRSIAPSILRSHYVNPKSLDAVLMNYEREVFADIHSLGRFSRFQPPDVIAHLLNVERTGPVTSTEISLPSPSPAVQQEESEISEPTTAEAPADMDLNLSQEVSAQFLKT